jgi:transmembrane sensor
MERGLDGDEDRAVVEATEWVMLLQEQPGDETLRRRFEAWLAASPDHATAWEELGHVSAVAATMSPAYANQWAPFIAERQALQVRPSSERFRGWRLSRRLTIMAAVAVAASLALVAAPTVVLHIEADYLTGVAEQRRIELPDGSLVALAPASAIAISYEAGERRVDLLSGEAFFQVQPDANRPFRVVTGRAEAVVLGTMFDVRLGPGEVTVAVQEGKVRVVADGARDSGERLGPGQSAQVTSDGIVSRGSGAPQLIGAWRHGQLYLEEQRLGDAVAQLRRYFHGVIVITGSSLADRRVTGAYDLADPERALRGMAQVHGATVRRITPWLLVMSAS